MMENLNEPSSLEIWEKRLSTRSEGTRKTYLNSFQKFIEWCKISPDELRGLKFKEDQSSSLGIVHKSRTW